MSGSVIPAILLIALLLGGSAQGPLAMLVVELASAVALAWAYVVGRAHKESADAKALVRWAWMCAALILIQLVSLPPALWKALPGRDLVVSGDALLNMPTVWRPLTLDIEGTAGTLAFYTVSLALIVVAVRRGQSRVQCAAAVVAAAIFGAIWGLGQRIGAAPHLYAFSSTGPTGQFANTNHLAALCVVALPFLASLVARAERKGPQGAIRMIGLLAALLLSLVTVLTGALAMTALLIPVLAVSAMIALRRPVKTKAMLSTLGALLVLGAATTVMMGDSAISATSRGTIWTQALALRDFMWTGSGFGTFERLYQTVIDPMRVDNFIVNHAHNDLLELIIEGGLPALVLLVVMIGWWVRATMRCWRPHGSRDAFAQAASVAVGVLLMHSLVDFPLRTLAMASTFAISLALLARQKPMKVAEEAGELRPTRHRRVR